MRLVVFMLGLFLVDCKSTRKKLQRTLPSAKDYQQDEGTQRQKRRLFWNCKVKRHVVDIDCEYYNAKGEVEEQDEELINPSKSWAQFMSQNEDTGSEFEKDFGISPKSAGSERLNAVEVIAGPRGRRGPPGLLKLEEFSEALQLLREVDGEVKKGRKGRYRASGPVLNVVFSNGAREMDYTNGAGNEDTGGFFGTLKTDLYLQRLSRIQVNNFLKPKASPSSFSFNRAGSFDHKSGALIAPITGVYMISATINLMRPDVETPDYDDYITGRICMDDNCLIWALETKIPVLQNKFANLKIDGLVRIEAGNKVFLFVENNSDVNFKILRSSCYSAHVV